MRHHHRVRRLSKVTSLVSHIAGRMTVNATSDELRSTVMQAGRDGKLPPQYQKIFERILPSTLALQ